jgi:murein DD-endopeptidase MepM/ murein hydrolase activator NlpD
MRNNQQTNTEPASSRPKAFWSAQILALSVFYLFFYTQNASAGIFDFLPDFMGKKVDAESHGSNITSSKLSILSSEAYDANLTQNAYNGIVPVADDEALSPIVGPEGTALDMDDAYVPDTDTISVYVVKKGDTIASIAKDFGVSTNTIIWANNLKKGEPLKNGTSLTILPVTGVRYVVKKGDTIASIAKKLSADAEDIRDYNDIADIDLRAGATIIVPDGEVVFVAEPKKKSSQTSTTSSKNSSTQSSSEKSKTNILQKIGSIFDATGPKAGQTITRSKHGEKTWGFDAPDAGSSYYSNPVPGAIKTQDLHGFNGVDFGAPRGTPIYAAASGTVIVSKAGGYNGGYGSYVVIAHANGTQTLYAHMSKVLASVGDNVDQGDKIGLVGSTGRSTGNHLHFEVRGAKNPYSDTYSQSSDTQD